MKITVCEQFHFEAAHRIESERREELARIHGHSHKVFVTVGGVVESKQGWLIEQSKFRAIASKPVQRLDHVFLNEILADVPAEGIAKYLLQTLQRADWPQNVQVLSVEVRKTTTRAKATA